MKKKLLLLVCLLFLVVGCQSERQKEENKIIKFVRDTMGDYWVYSKEKLIINDDYSVQIKMYNVDNWLVCLKSAEEFSEFLNAKVEEDSKLEKITYACSTNNKSDVNSYIEVDNIKTINMKDFNNEVKIMDSKKNLVTDSLEDAEKQFKEEYINKCKEYDYKEISSDTAKHRGEYAMFSGEVFEMFEGDGYYFLVINVTLKDNKYEDMIGVSLPTYALEKEVKEKEIVKVYGKLDGDVTYKIKTGNNITMPKLNAEYIEFN